MNAYVIYLKTKLHEHQIINYAYVNYYVCAFFEIYKMCLSNDQFRLADCLYLAKTLILKFSWTL